MDIEDLAEKINNKSDFESFLKNLIVDFDKNKQDWENVSLRDFLEAMHAYSEDIEGYYMNMKIAFNPERPNWKVFADILLGAKVYE